MSDLSRRVEIVTETLCPHGRPAPHHIKHGPCGDGEFYCDRSTYQCRVGKTDRRVVDHAEGIQRAVRAYEGTYPTLHDAAEAVVAAYLGDE